MINKKTQIVELAEGLVNAGIYAEIVNAYDYNCTLKRYVLNRYFYYYLKNNYLKGAKNEKSIS